MLIPVPPRVSVQQPAENNHLQPEHRQVQFVEPSQAERRKRAANTSESVHRACFGCGATSSPEWRRGPYGKDTLCNACGLRYAKKVKRVNESKERMSIGFLLNQSEEPQQTASRPGQPK
jgi:hypothetical protein